MPGQFEVEQKFPVSDAAALEQRLAMLGAVLDSPVEQVDTYLAHPCRDFAQTDEALRLRQIGPANFVTYKGPKLDALTKTRRELELELPPGAACAAKFHELLAALGFRAVAQVHKQRRKAALYWRQRQFEISLDDVRHVGLYVELETSADAGDLDSARAALADLAAVLALSGGERRSYLELLLQNIFASTHDARVADGL